MVLFRDKISSGLENFWEFDGHEFVQELNTARGEVDRSGIPLLGQIFANKYIWGARKIIENGLTSFDPHYLFFEGDLNKYRSTRVMGITPLILLIPLLAGLQARNAFFLILAALFSGFWREAYITLPRMPFILGVYWTMATGMHKLILQKPWILKLILTIWMGQMIPYWYYVYKFYWPPLV